MAALPDFTEMVQNIGPSIDPLYRVMTGFCYLVGAWLLWSSLKKIRDVADARARYGGGGKVFVPLAYAMGGFALFYLPSMAQVAQNTFFGTSSPMAYANWLTELRQTYGDSTYVLTRLAQLAGLIWFVRGILLLVQASEPGIQYGPKGMGFMIAGILAMNVKYTANAVAYIVNLVTTHTT